MKIWKNRSLHRGSFLSGMAAGLLLVVIAAVAYIAVPFVKEPSSPYSPSTWKKLVLMQSVIRSNFLNDIDEQEQVNQMFAGLVAGLNDKYAAYYTKEEYESIRMSNAGQMEGIGVSISQDVENGYLLVSAVQEDSPAARAGVQVGDHIVTILGQDTAEMSSSEAAQLIRTSEDKTITLSVVREGSEDPIELTMEKEAINQNVVTGGLTEDGIGYIYISSFNKLTAEQFQDAYDQLQEQGMKALVIDLRGNRGGLVEACCDTLRIFMPKGDLVYEQDRSGHETSRSCKGEHPIEIPLAVLVNENSASASEMFTGAVQDYGVGVVIGTSTYGKGIEQESYTFGDGSVLKLTTTKYLTPNHHDLNGTGITPDTYVEAVEDNDVDEQFEEARKQLLEK